MVSPCSFTMVAKSLKISLTSKMSDCKANFFRNYAFFKYFMYKHSEKVHSLSCNCKYLSIIPMKFLKNVQVNLKIIPNGPSHQMLKRKKMLQVAYEPWAATLEIHDFTCNIHYGSTSVLIETVLCKCCFVKE